MSKRIGVGVAFAATAALMVGGTAGTALAGGNSNTNVNETMWHVGANPNCGSEQSAVDGGTKQGQAVVHSNARGVTLDVGISGAAPNSKYSVGIHCVAGDLVWIYTDAYGTGSAEVTLTAGEAAYVDANPFWVSAETFYPNPSPTYGDTFMSSEFPALDGS